MHRTPVAQFLMVLSLGAAHSLHGATAILAQYDLDGGPNGSASATSVPNDDPVDFQSVYATNFNVTAGDMIGSGFTGWAGRTDGNLDVVHHTGTTPTSDTHTWWNRGQTSVNALTPATDPHASVTLSVGAANQYFDFTDGELTIDVALHDRNATGNYTSNIAVFHDDGAGTLTQMGSTWTDTVDNNNRAYDYQPVSFSLAGAVPPGTSSTATFRIYQWDNSGVTNKHTLFDRITITGAIPEPSRGLLLALGGLFLVTRRCR